MFGLKTFCLPFVVIVLQISCFFMSHLDTYFQFFSRQSVVAIVLEISWTVSCVLNAFRLTAE